MNSGFPQRQAQAKPRVLKELHVSESVEGVVSPRDLLRLLVSLCIRSDSDVVQATLHRLDRVEIRNLLG
jgi:hypothetical protein